MLENINQYNFNKFIKFVRAKPNFHFDPKNFISCLINQVC